MITEIERDLVRWGKRKWSAIIVFILGLHLGLIYWAGRPTEARRVYPKLPQFSFATEAGPAGTAPAENPLLFASAQWNGFSGSGWMQEPEMPNPVPEVLPPPRLLSHDRARDILPSPALPSRSYQIPYRIPPPSLVPGPAPAEGASTYVIEGNLEARGLAAPLELPPQRHNDVIGSSVVQVGVDPDGTVLSARLIASSGFRQADADALAIARQARFKPAGPARGSEGPNLDWGKLIFHWFALELSSTNTLKR